MKKTGIIALVLAMVLVLGACAPAAPKTQESKEEPKTQQKAEDQKSEQKAEDQKSKEKGEVKQDAAEKLELTLEELAKYNGKDGQKAYIAVDGVIYDVTEHPAWKNGGHNGFEAGQDLTEAIRTKSPHGVSKLDGLTAVGSLK